MTSENAPMRIADIARHRAAAETHFPLLFSGTTEARALIRTQSQVKTQFFNLRVSVPPW
jgi:hypothetical protein